MPEWSDIPPKGPARSQMWVQLGKRLKEQSIKLPTLVLNWQTCEIVLLFWWPTDVITAASAACDRLNKRYTFEAGKECVLDERLHSYMYSPFLVQNVPLVKRSDT